MGLYSTNRVSDLIEATDIELLPDSSFGDIIECNIQLCEHERMMFESLIELDFVSATNEAVLTEAEAEEKNKAADGEKKIKIGEKVSQIIDNAIAAIKKAFANFIAKFQQIAADRVVKKYSDALKKDGALNGFKGIEDFAMPIGFAFNGASYDKDEKNNKDNRASRTAKFEALYGIESLNTCKTIEEVNNIVDEIKETNKNLENKNPDSFYFHEEQKSFVPNSNDISDAIYIFQEIPEYIKNAKKTAADIITELNKIKREAKRERKTGNNELDLAISKAKYDIIVENIKYCNYITKKDFEMAKRQIAAYRRLIVICGKYALKNANDKSSNTAEENEEEVNKESALDYIIGESSDQYVYNVFAN